MFSRRGPILIVVSLLLAVAAAWVANRWLIAQATPDDAGPSTISVVTAAIDIPLGTKIEARHVASIQMLKDTAPAGAFQSLAEVEGKVATAGMVSGEILLGARLAEQGKGSTLAAVVGANMRAVAVRVNDVAGVGGFLLPGNRVDVVSAYREGSVTRSETVVQNVKVLAVDQTASSDSNEPVVVRAVTLEVTPGDAEKLALAEQRGSIQLALRNPLDEKVTRAPAPAATAPARVQVAPPQPARGITVIRGTDVGKEIPENKR